jgi:small subunit ribosomal protein S24e
LNRVQFVIDVFHPNVGKVTKEQIREQIQKKFKKAQISLFGLKKIFGGGRTRGFGLVYDNEDSMKKYEPVHRIRKMQFEKLEPKERKKILKDSKREGRKIRKVKKHQQQKKTGTVRRQAKRLAQKQNKKKKK